MYQLPSGFMLDSQIFLIGLLSHQFVEKVLRFNHVDFLKALKVDLGPILGNVGLWALKNLQSRARQSGDDTLKKKYNICIDIVDKYMESGLDLLG